MSREKCTCVGQETPDYVEIRLKSKKNKNKKLESWPPGSLSLRSTVSWQRRIGI